jgi:hypothetical protein
MLKRSHLAILVPLTTLSLVSMSAVAYAAQPHAPTAPAGRSCPPQQTFTHIRYTTEDLGNGRTGAWGFAHNRTRKAAPYSVTLGTDSAVSYSISSSVSADAGVIFASASASVSVGISYTHTDSFHQTLQISVPAHRYGVIGVDNSYYRFVGTYTIVHSNCTESVSKHTVALFPTDTSEGLEGATTKHDPVRPPYPLAPGT